jgi:hypothetical protein
VLDDRGIGVQFPAGIRIFLFSAASWPAQGPTQSPTQWILGALSAEIKRQEREAS